MPKNTGEVLVGANGSVYVAPVGTAAPADPVIAPAAAWVDLGYVDEDGVSFTKSKDTDEVPAWQSFYPVRRLVTGESVTLGLNLLQWNKDTVRLAFGGGTITTVPAAAGPPATVLHYRYNPPAAGIMDERALMIDWNDDYKWRLVIPKGMVTDDVETNITKSDAAVLPIGFDVSASDGTDPWYLLTTDPAFAA